MPQLTVGCWTRLQWKRLFLLLWTTSPVCGAAQIGPADLPGFTYHWPGLLPRLTDGDGVPSLASTNDSRGTDGGSQVISPDPGVRHREVPADRFQWKSALAQYSFEISIQVHCAPNPQNYLQNGAKFLASGMRGLAGKLAERG